MWKNAGIIRNKKGLILAKEKVRKTEKKLKPISEIGINREVQELNNMILLSKIIIYSALRRKESRGTHFILEYPERYDNIWKKHLTVNKGIKKIKQPKIIYISTKFQKI